jgi:hypothetical protein
LESDQEFGFAVEEYQHLYFIASVGKAYKKLSGK